MAQTIPGVIVATSVTGRKLDGVENVKAYKNDDGTFVKGDGMQNDTSGLQRALDNARGGLLFPRGIYRVTAGLVLRRNLDLIGTGRRDAVIRGDFLPAGTDLLTIAMTENWGYADIRSWRMANLTLSLNAGGRHGCFIQTYTPNVAKEILASKIENCSMAGTLANNGYGLYIDNNFAHGRITGCTFDSIYLKCYDANLIDKNLFFGTRPSITFDIINGIRNNVVRDCTAVNRDGQVHIINGSNIRIQNNQFEHMAGQGVNQSPHGAMVWIEGRDRQCTNIVLSENNYGGGTNVDRSVYVGNALKTVIEKGHFVAVNEADVELSASAVNTVIASDNLTLTQLLNPRTDTDPLSLVVVDNGTGTEYQHLGQKITNPTANRVDGRVLGISGGQPAWVVNTATAAPAGVALFDSFAGATSDIKMAAALSYAAAQTRVPVIQMPAGVTTLANSYDMFTGMKLVGAGTENMAFGEEVASGKAVISKIRFTGASGTSSLFKSATTINYVTVANLAFHGDADCQIFQSTGNVYGAQFHNLDFYGCLSAFGNATNKFLMTFSHFTGFWTVNAPAGTQFWLGGSDNTLWMGGQANIGGNPSTAGAGKYLAELQGLSKTNVGYAYITANNGWRGLRTSGDCAGLTLYGGVYEGQNDGDPSYGNLIRCEGTGTVRIRDPFLAYGMTSPAGTEHGIVEVACSANGQVLLDGFTYRRDNDVAETVPVAYVSGGSLRVSNGMADKQYNTWTGLPRVQNAGGTLTNDTSVTVLP